MKIVIMMASIVLLLFVGCEPEDAKEVVTDFNASLTDPNSSIQVTAENLQELVETGMILVRAIPGFPYAKAILGALAIVQAVIGIILGWRKNVNKRALKEVVLGNEILKKGPIDSQAFKDAQNTAQSEPTTELVNKIRAKIA